MKGKILFVVGLGVGYVLGTRAGRERYEQISRAAERVWNRPDVQQGVGTVKDFAMSRVGDLSETVLDGVKGLIGNATKGSGASRADVSRAARSAKESITKAAGAARSAVDDAASKLEGAVDETAEVASKSANSKPANSKPRATASKPASGGPATSGPSATSGS